MGVAVFMILCAIWVIISLIYPTATSLPNASAKKQTTKPELKPEPKPELKPEPKPGAQWKGQGGHPYWTDGKGKYWGFLPGQGYKYVDFVVSKLKQKLSWAGTVSDIPEIEDYDTMFERYVWDFEHGYKLSCDVNYENVCFEWRYEWIDDGVLVDFPTYTKVLEEIAALEYAEEFAKEHQIPFEPKQEQEDAKPYWVTDGEGTYWVRGTGNIVSGGPSDSYINFFGEMFQDETCLMAPWAGGEDTVTEYISCHKVKIVHIGPDITEIRWGAFGGCCDIESIHFASADTMIYDGIFGSEWSSCTKRFVNGEYKFTVHAPAGGAVEEFARKHNLEFVLEEKI